MFRLTLGTCVSNMKSGALNFLKVPYWHLMHKNICCHGHITLAICPFTRLQNALRVLAMAWASLGVWVCLSVTLCDCIKTVQARITKSSLWDAPRTLVCRDKFLCPWVRGFPSNEGVKEGHPLKDVFLLLLARIAWKRLQIGTDMPLIITSTGDGLFKFINIDDLEWSWAPKIGAFSEFFTIFDCSTHFKSELWRNG